MTNIESELRSLLSDSPKTSAEVRLALCEGRFPSVLAELQKRIGVSDSVPSVRKVGKALRRIADETGAIRGRRGGHIDRNVWSTAEAATASRYSDANVDIHTPIKSAQVSGIPGQVAGQERGLEVVVSSTKGQAGGDDNPRSNPELHCPRAPKGYHLRGVSTMVDGEGKVSAQWIKTTADPDGNRLEALLEELRKLPDGFSDSHQPKPAPTHLDADLLCLIPLGDPHLGLRVWSEEAGNDYDISIAERAHVDAIRKLISVVPSAKQALIVSLGDLLHCDNNSARTTRSGNELDVDTRWQKVMRVGLRMLRSMIDMSLTKFETVRIVCEQGNHDDLSSIMMAMMLEAFYSKDQRVSVDTSPSPFHYYRFGKNLIGTTHGAETKPEQLPMIMAADRPEDWGATEHRRWLCGHVHHESVREFPGVTAEWFRSLAPRDAWANAKGYRAGRDMRCDVLHREYGFVSRYAIGINQLDVA